MRVQQHALVHKIPAAREAAPSAFKMFNFMDRAVKAIIGDVESELLVAQQQQQQQQHQQNHGHVRSVLYLRVMYTHGHVSSVLHESHVRIVLHKSHGCPAPGINWSSI
jgi:hypothetical protein